MSTLEKTRLDESGHSPIREAVGGPPKGLKREITLARAGWGTSGYYSEAVLKRDGPKVFPVGTKMYLDHPTLTEETDRPERSVKDLAAVITKTPRMAGIDLVAECELVEHWAPVINALAERGMIDLSLRAYGLEEMGDAGGKRGPIIHELLEGISVDFVTDGGLGGKVGRLIEEARGHVPVEEALASELREGLSSAGREKWASDEVYVYVEDYDVDENWAIFCVSPDTYASYYIKSSFLRDESGNVALTGEPEKVEREISFVVSESQDPTKLEEARNFGEWLEARLHRQFTETTDSMFGEGYLDREERIALSSAIGEALEAFNTSVQSNIPQLYERDPYAEPGKTGTAVSENDRSGGPREREDSMSDASRLSELEESFRQFKEDTERKLAESETKVQEAEARADRADEALKLREAGSVVDGVVGQIEGLPSQARQRIVESVLRKGVPTVSDGSLDRGILEERARAGIREEQEYLTSLSGGGSSGGGSGVDASLAALGESRRDDGPAAQDSDLEQVFQRMGLSESASKVAAGGRVID